MVYTDITLASHYTPLQIAICKALSCSYCKELAVCFGSYQ